MIFDSMKNCSLYYSLNSRFERAFNYLNSTDLAALEAGKHVVDGDDIFVNVVEGELKQPQDALLEVHNTYADIQVVIKGVESFGWRDRKECNEPREGFNEEKDVQFFLDEHQTRFMLHEGQFAIMLPEDGHAPMIGEGAIKKLIVKVRM